MDKYDDHAESMLAPALSRRAMLGAVGATVGALAASETRAVPASGAAASDPCSVRIAAVSYSPPFHNHRKDGVNLGPLREMTAKVAKERPDFICYPEICASVAAGFNKGIETAPELEPYVAEVGKIAREFNTAIVAPLLERSAGRVYNSVPIVDRKGKLVLVYHKNYPTILELEAGISPGTEIPVAQCDGVRVGAAVCFDANFEPIAAELERQRARLVFWPSMYWGGQLLQYWALRYGFAVTVAYDVESAVIDMNGRYLVRQGTDTWQVRAGHLPPWAVADVRINRELFHLDGNMKKFPEIRAKYTPDVDIEVMEPEGFFLLSSRRPDLPVEAVAAEFGLETLRDFLARSVRLRNERLPPPRAGAAPPPS
ncbi:MAG: carbon-nitrogen hydrolase family protein [Pirellulales bacterium]|nr:carbon-nitrogen hydrolase family protein [Pirellulales bacterium]